jgi:hypothetical protein
MNKVFDEMGKCFGLFIASIALAVWIGMTIVFLGDGVSFVNEYIFYGFMISWVLIVAFCVKVGITNATFWRTQAVFVFITLVSWFGVGLVLTVHTTGAEQTGMLEEIQVALMPFIANVAPFLSVISGIIYTYFGYVETTKKLNDDELNI